MKKRKKRIIVNSKIKGGKIMKTKKMGNLIYKKVAERWTKYWDIKLTDKEKIRHYKSLSNFFAIILVTSIVTIILALFYYSGSYYLNLSRRFPIGFYKISDINNLDGFKKNEIVIIKPRADVLLFLHKRGYLGKNRKYLGKKIIGLPGDIVERKGNDVYLNGKLIGVTLGKDSRGEIVKYNLTNGVIPANYFFVGGTTLRSYDSKYLGLISKNEIMKKAKLVLPLKFLDKH